MEQQNAPKRHNPDRAYRLPVRYGYAEQWAVHHAQHGLIEFGGCHRFCHA